MIDYKLLNKMRNKFLFNYMDLFTFLVIFSFYNDAFIVDLFGENSLKIIYVIFFVLNIKKIIFNFRFLAGSQYRMLFLFLFSLVVSYLVESIIYGVSDKIVNVFFLIFIIIIIVTYFSFYPLKKLLYMVWISVMISIVIAYFSEPVSEWTFRKAGGTSDPNEFAAQLLTFLFISIFLYLNNKNRIFLLTSIIFFIYGIFIAGSKSSFAILGIILLFYFIKNIKLKYILNLKFFVIMLVALISLNYINFDKFKLVDNMLKRTESEGTAYTRMNSWIAGLHMVEERPIVGFGISEYSHFSSKYSEVKLAESSMAPHNIYVQLIAESGIIVLFIFLMFLYSLMLNNWKLVAKSKYIFLWYSTFSILLMGLTLGLTYEKYLWLSLTIILNVNNIFKNKYYKSERN